MTREEAINILNALKFILNNDQYTDEIEEALDMAISALQQPNQFADGDKKDDHLREVTKKVSVISRQAAIDALRVAYWDKNIQSAKNDPCIVDAMTDWAIRQIKELPSAQPEQRWIPVTERMPDKKDWYIFSTDKLVWVAFWNGIEWSGGVVSAVLKDIIAWKPFPAPYRKEGEAE